MPGVGYEPGGAPARADRGETDRALAVIVALLGAWIATEAGTGSTEFSERKAMEDDRFLSLAQVAEMLQVSMRTLDRYRRAGTGPDYYRFGNRVRYRQRDVTAWAEARNESTEAHPGEAGRQTGD